MRLADPLRVARDCNHALSLYAAFEAGCREEASEQPQGASEGYSDALTRLLDNQPARTAGGWMEPLAPLEGHNPFTQEGSERLKGDQSRAMELARRAKARRPNACSCGSKGNARFRWPSPKGRSGWIGASSPGDGALGRGRALDSRHGPALRGDPRVRRSRR